MEILLRYSDLRVLWEIGRDILAGLSPYHLAGSWYPPAASYLFVPLALIPLPAAYILIGLANLAAAAYLIRQHGRWWAFFLPLAYILIAGQIDLFIMVMALWLRDRDPDWKSIIFAALITLKPITAVIILPWFLVRWMIHERRAFWTFAAVTAALQLWPVFVRPSVFAEWAGRLMGGGASQYAGGIGIWLIAEPGTIGIVIFGLIAAVISGFALAQDDAQASRALLAFASPFMLFYHPIVLMGKKGGLALSVVYAATMLLLASGASHSWMILIGLVALYATSFDGLTISAISRRIRLAEGR
jgi:hypothetical protein